MGVMAKIHKINFLGFICLMMFSCRNEPSESSKVKYLLTGSKGLVASADQSQVTICSNRPARNSEIKNAVSMWYAALNKKPDIQITEVGAAGRCAAIVNYENIEGPSNTTITDQPLVTMNEQDQWFSSFPVLLHEFGHGFGLSDTYNLSSGQSGDCVAGQPKEAVMCTPPYAQPQQDDIDGASRCIWWWRF